MPDAVVMLRFPTAFALTREDLALRRRLCAEAQRACDEDRDILVPEGVEIVVRYAAAPLPAASMLPPVFA